MNPSEEYVHVPMKEPKYCFVPTCKNNSRKDKNTIFFVVPSSGKQEWCKSLNVGCPKRALYICEAHLNLKEDVENYLYWTTMKARPKLRSSLPASLVEHTSGPEPSTSSSSSITTPFPSNPTVAAQWIKQIRLNRKESNWKPTKHTKICSAHFDDKEKYITKGGNRKLREGAIPTKALQICCTDETQISGDQDPLELDVSQMQQNPNEANLEGIHSMPLNKERISQDVEHESIAADKQNEIAVQQRAEHAYVESSWAREQEKSQTVDTGELPEARQIIANVYHYLQKEYETLKSSIGDSCDLTPLANIRSRTAAATGVSEETVTEALKTRKRSKDSKRKIKRPKMDTYFDDSDVSPIEEESSDESADEDQPPIHEEHHEDEGGVGGLVKQEEPEVYALKVEVDDEEETQCAALNERISMDAVDPLSHGTSSEFSLMCSTLAEVKPEPIKEEEDPPMDTYVHFNEPPLLTRADEAPPADGGSPLLEELLASPSPAHVFPSSDSPGSDKRGEKKHLMRPSS